MKKSLFIALSLILSIALLVGCGHKTDPKPKEKPQNPVPKIQNSKLLYVGDQILLLAYLGPELLAHQPTHLQWQLNQLQKKGCILCMKKQKELRLDLSTQSLEFPEGLFGPLATQPAVQVQEEQDGEDGKKKGQWISIYFTPEDLQNQNRFIGVATTLTASGATSPQSPSILLVPPKDVSLPKVQKTEIWKLTCDLKGKRFNPQFTPSKKNVTLQDLRKKNRGDKRKDKNCLASITKEVTLTWQPKQIQKGKVLDAEGNLKDYFQIEPMLLLYEDGKLPPLAKAATQTQLTRGFYRLPVKRGRWTIHRIDSYGNLSKGEVVYEDAP